MINSELQKLIWSPPVNGGSKRRYYWQRLIFRTIKSDDETSKVLDKIESYSGVRLPIDYASNAKIVGVFLHNQLSACYMLVTKPSFRSLAFVPDQVKKTGELFQKDPYEMMEVNGLWIGPAIKKPTMQLQIWTHLIIDIFKSRKKYVLLMRDSRTKSMRKFINMANPISLYKGAPFLMAGDKSHEDIQVSYTTRWKIVLNSHKYIAELWNRHKRAEAFAKQRDLMRTLKQSEAEYV